ncbi:MAG: lanthionine synthetase LanC family protein [Acidobacteriota bacterium]
MRAWITVTGLFLLVLGCVSPPPPELAEAPAPSPPTKYFEAARKAATWVDSQTQESETGLTWYDPWQPEEGTELPEDFPLDLVSVGQGLYHGNAGVIRFWLEAYRFTDDETYLDRAKRGADYVLARLPSAAPEDPQYAGAYGSHDGWGGVLWMLEQVYQASGEERYRDGARRLLDQLHADARDDGAGGVHWREGNELFYGNAGHGLLLLWAAETFDHPPSRELAERAGRWLLTSSKPREGGITWPWGEQRTDLVMPNFSHGTAGVAYFLARLHQATGDDVFLDAALDGASHLTTVANRGESGDHCLIFHHEDRPDREGEDRYYLGFCHGPVGTSRLFEGLYQATGDETWREWVAAGTRAVAESGIPEQQTDGYWNNVSQCCGSAGVIDHFIDQYRLTGDRAHLHFAIHMADDLLARASEENGGFKWIQAEHRVQPDNVQAHVGYMQGAAGIAASLFHLDAALRGIDTAWLRFIDDPWADGDVAQGT